MCVQPQEVITQQITKIKTLVRLLYNGLPGKCPKRAQHNAYVLFTQWVNSLDNKILLLHSVLFYKISQ